MDKIILYKVVSEINLRDFQEKVNKLIGEGWELYGSLVVTDQPDATTFSQALVMKDDI